MIITFHIGEWVSYRGQTIYALYTDYLIIVGPDQEEIDQIIYDLKISKFILTIVVHLQYFLKVNK